MDSAIDITEFLQVCTAVLGTLLTLRALHVCVLTSRRAKVETPHLVPAVDRRMRYQLLLLLIQSTFLITGVICLYLPIGPTQSAVRNFTLIFVGLVVLVLSMQDHIEGLRWPWGQTAGRRRTDLAGEPGDRAD